VWPRPPAGHTLVFGSRPHNAGRRYCDKFIYLGLLPAPVGGESDITEQYVKKHGKPRPGSRVIILTVQQMNGWRDVPQRTEAIFRGEQGPGGPAKAPPSESGGLISPRDTLRIYNWGRGGSGGRREGYKDHLSS
jgi:hypothetical protein